jgi:hypothetical protein
VETSCLSPLTAAIFPLFSFIPGLNENSSPSKANNTSFHKKSFVYPLHQNIQVAKPIKRFISTMPEFPPEKVRAIVSEVAALLKERKETVSVAETVCSFPFAVHGFA